VKWTPGTIRALRDAREETQEDFAHALGVRTSTVNRWEMGHAKPSKHTAKLLDALAETGRAA
jgi:DNA-binding transcriptional regulator YiaG